MDGAVLTAAPDATPTALLASRIRSESGVSATDSVEELCCSPSGFQRDPTYASQFAWMQSALASAELQADETSSSEEEGVGVGDCTRSTPSFALRISLWNRHSSVRNSSPSAPSRSSRPDRTNSNSNLSAGGQVT